MFQNPVPAVVLAATLAVSGCSVYSIVGAVPPSPEEAAEINRITATPESTQAFLAGTTVKGYEKLHGTQIEYLGRNGLASLWYPGNTETVPSRWKVEQAGGGSEVCFKYPTRSYNPVTGEGGGFWECHPAVEYLYLHDEIREGDPLGLASGRVPYVMPKETDVSIAAAMQKSGSRKKVGKNKVTWQWRN